MEICNCTSTEWFFHFSTSLTYSIPLFFAAVNFFFAVNKSYFEHALVSYVMLGWLSCLDAQELHNSQAQVIKGQK